MFKRKWIVESLLLFIAYYLFGTTCIQTSIRFYLPLLQEALSSCNCMVNVIVQNVNNARLHFEFHHYRCQNICTIVIFLTAITLMVNRFLLYLHR